MGDDGNGSSAVGEIVDALIIGGGSNGTGLARDLAKRGASVVLCEKGDFARGATGASSAMIHGGPRYLLDDVDTTKHACEDSGYIQKIVPHLLFRVPFLVPIRKGDTYGRLQHLLADVYFDVYDRYTPLKNGLPHASLTVEQMMAMEPRLRGDFMGAVTLDEWGIDPGRLCVLNAADAAAHGADIRTYTEVVGLLREGAQVCGARVRAQGSASTEDIRAKTVINCGGPWASALAGLGGADVYLRPGKGVHLIYEKRVTNFAIVAEAEDGREIFVMPYQNETWIGTTDDDYYGDLDDLWATKDEIDYLEKSVSRLLPEIAEQRLIGTRVGVRNTVGAWGEQEDALSRRFDVIDHAKDGAPGFFSLVGGKLASFRVQAEEVADRVCLDLGNKTACRTHIDRLPGGDEAPKNNALVKEYGISPLEAERVLSRHGALSPKVLDVGRESASGFATICVCEPTLECEVRYCIRHEMVRHLGDLMVRCRLGLGACQGIECGLRAAQIFAEERGLDVEDERAALMDFLSRRWRSVRPVLSQAQLAAAELMMIQYTGLWRKPTLTPFA